MSHVQNRVGFDRPLRDFGVAELGSLSCKRLLALFWFLAVAAGGFHAWADRNVMNADGISYLEIGEAYLRGDWDAAINGYWSPLYPWLLGLAMLILKPSPYWENPTIHLVNFLIYLFSLVCFHFFLRELIRTNQRRAAGLSGDSWMTFPVWAWIALGYSLFIWSSLTLNTLAEVNPDMCMAAFVYLASCILLRIRRGSKSWVTFGFLGLVLGTGYLVKAPMFPLAFVFTAVAMLSLRNLRLAALRGLIAILMFILVAAPFIGALSMTKGRLTFGDSARLNYALDIHNVSLRHWQGTWPPGVGAPKHATRKIQGTPPVYEFGSPVAGTYPPWYDPSYWNEGMSPSLNLRKQVEVFFSNIGIYLNLFINNSQAGIMVGFLILLLANRRGWFQIGEIAKQWTLLIPALAAFSMYSFVHVYTRFVGAFVVLLWLGVGSSVRLTDTRDSKNLVSYVCVSMVTLLLMSIAVVTAPKVYSTVRELLQGADPSAHLHWRVAEGLSRLGVQPGDKVALLGDGTYKFGAYWSRLARVKVVAEVLTRDVDEFLAANDVVKSGVIGTVLQTGATAIVAYDVPNYFAKNGWRRLEKTHYFVYLIDNQRSETSARADLDVKQ
jgi:hypothetical protein